MGRALRAAGFVGGSDRDLRNTSTPMAPSVADGDLAGERAAMPPAPHRQKRLVITPNTLTYSDRLLCVLGGGLGAVCACGGARADHTSRLRR